ncbi:MAG: DUF4351 domain-containing protein [Magnetococcus sp. YQC-9]
MEQTDRINRSHYDTTFKDLFAQPPQQLVQLLMGRRAVQNLPVEFASTQKRIPDCLFLLEDDALLHLELQSQPEPMEWRMLIYRAMIRQRYPDHPLIQKVLYVGEKSWKSLGAIEESDLSFRFGIVDIRDIDCQMMMASPSLAENILAILCRLEDPLRTIREVLLRISELPPKARTDALTRLLILSRLRSLENIAQTEAHEMALTFNLLDNDVFRPMILKELHESEQRGRRESAVSMLKRLMKRRFGIVPEWALAKIEQADPERLELLGERMLDAASIEELLAD